MNAARAEAHAKVNLTLRVLGRRPDGYHMIESVVMPLALHDDVELRVVGTGGDSRAHKSVLVETIAEGVDCSALCEPGDNLCAKAVRAFMARLPESAPLRGATLAIRVVKRIPLGGGLGGGSADAAAVFRMLRALAGPGAIDEAAILAAAAEVGSDVPALFLGGPVLMRGRGENVTRLDPGRFAPLPVVVANPGVHVSTAAAYADWDGLAARRTDSRQSSAALPDSALSSAESYGGILANDLQESVFAKYPQVAGTARLLRDAGARHVLMAGSGASVFAIVDSTDEAERIAAGISSSCWTSATRLAP